MAIRNAISRVSVNRTNLLAEWVRRGGGAVVSIQHDGQPGDDFEPSTPGWELLSSLTQGPGDRVVRKKLNGDFFETPLHSLVKELRAEKVFFTGWVTDFCVDATVRTAASLRWKTVVVSDGHTLSDRPHLSAEQVIEHHHYVWQSLICEHPVRVMNADEFKREPT